MAGPSPVEFLDHTDITFVEHPPPKLTPRERSEVDRMWQETRARNPATFDGPIAAALGVDRPHEGSLRVRWAPMTYRARALRSLRPPHEVPGSMFVTALVPTQTGVLIGRGAPGTASPGVWALPGGTVEPPVTRGRLDMAHLRRHAARELIEETGVSVRAEDLHLWAVTRGRRWGSLGFHFACPTTCSELILRRHAGLANIPCDQGLGPELDEIAFVTSPPDAPALGPTSDYLLQVLNRYFIV